MGNWVYRLCKHGGFEVGYYVWPWKFVAMETDLDTTQARALVRLLNGGN
jgi:hypothetical protein